MGEDDRQRVLVLRAHMDKVNPDPIDLRAILRKTVDLLLSSTPVVLGTPIFDQCAHLLQWYTLGPIRNGLTVGPARHFEATFEIVKSALRNVDGERGDGGRAGRRAVCGKEVRDHTDAQCCECGAGSAGFQELTT